MKYAQLIIGLLAGTAIGGAVVVSAGNPLAGAGLNFGGGVDRESVKQIVRDTISEEPQLIMDSVQKFQEARRKQTTQNANELLKDPAAKAEIYEFADAAFVGPKDAKKVVVEFYDYDCPACHMMFKSIDKVLEKNKDVKVIFREFPIFGPTSEKNSQIAIAVNRLYPAKYFQFHEKMMGGTGKNSEEKTLGFVKELGMNVEKVKAEAAKPDVQETIEATKKLASKLGIQGTPSLIVGEELVPHAMSAEDLEAKLNALPAN